MISASARAVASPAAWFKAVMSWTTKDPRTYGNLANSFDLIVSTVLVTYDLDMEHRIGAQVEVIEANYLDETFNRVVAGRRPLPLRLRRKHLRGRVSEESRPAHFNTGHATAEGSNGHDGNR